MEKNPIKFRLISTGRYVFAELDGKTIGPGITDLHFNAKDESGGLKNQLNLSIDLDAFEFCQTDPLMKNMRNIKRPPLERQPLINN